MGGKATASIHKRPTTPSERKSNFVKHMNGYPWIAIAEDKSGTARYFCGTCGRVATVSHLLSHDHIQKTTTNYGEKVGYHIPRWMARFKGISTTDKSGHLLLRGVRHLARRVR